MDTLSSASTGYWELPDSLEPNAVMPYYWGMKGTDEAGNELPLFLYLHGSGPKEREWSTGLNICRNFDDAPSVYFIPQIPNEGEYYRWWQKAKQFAWEKLLRQSLLLGKIDPNRVYVLESRKADMAVSVWPHFMLIIGLLRDRWQEGNL